MPTGTTAAIRFLDFFCRLWVLVAPDLSALISAAVLAVLDLPQ
jgi:hypothetical protein